MAARSSSPPPLHPAKRFCPNSYGSEMDTSLNIPPAPKAYRRKATKADPLKPISHTFATKAPLKLSFAPLNDVEKTLRDDERRKTWQKRFAQVSMPKTAFKPMPSTTIAEPVTSSNAPPALLPSQKERDIDLAARLANLSLHKPTAIRPYPKLK